METGTTALTNLGEIFSQILTWVGDMLDVIFSNPVLMVGLSIFIVGAVIALVYRMVRGG